MIKVCHMTSAHGPEDVRIFHKECVSLARAGYDVYLVERGESYEKNGVHIVGVGEIPDGRLKRMTVGARAVYRKALALDADIYHFHDPELLPYGLKLKKKGKRVIFDSHETTLIMISDEKTWIPAALRSLVARWYARMERSVCGRLDSVIYVSPGAADYFRKLNPKAVEITNYPILTEALEPAFRGKKIVFAGGITGKWNHHVILKALEHTPDFRYCLCGTADPGYLLELKSYPAWAQVDFLGKIPHEAVGRVIAENSAGMALLSYNRSCNWNLGTMGNTKIFEEMMAGLPVVCTDFVLWKEFVERYHCGICVNPENVDEIAAAIRYLLDHPDEARQMGENGRRAVKEEFNWGVEEKKLLALYEDILSEGE